MQEHEAIQAVTEEGQDEPMTEIDVLRSRDPCDPRENNKSRVKPDRHFDHENDCGRRTILGLTECLGEHDENVADAMQPRDDAADLPEIHQVAAAIQVDRHDLVQCHLKNVFRPLLKEVHANYLLHMVAELQYYEHF